MAGLTTIATVALAGLDLLQRAAAARTGAAQARLARDAQEAATRARLGQLEADRDAAARARAERLRRNLAAARARLGARGIAGDEGSGAALLQGLAADSATAGAEESARYARRIDALLRDAAYDRERDLLSRADRRARERLGLLRSGARLLG